MDIWQNISQRSEPTMTISRRVGNDIVVPITQRSIRRFMLMQEDFIQLEFSLPTAELISIGDYVQDELFGRFYIFEEQMPRYNQSSGGYDYSLKFEAAYMGWRNWIFCLVANNKRVESRWNLTDTLNSHVQQIADNINIITDARTTPYIDTETGTTIYACDGYGIEVNAANATEIKHLQYEGNNIIEALNMMAEAWSCEWWVTNDSITIGDTTYAKTIHFGKCHDAGEPYVMALGDNVESMDIARDQQTYANRIYVYGGTQNIPEDYDRKLEFTAKTTPRVQTFFDENRELKLDMIDAPSSIPATSLILGSWTTAGTNPKTHTQRTEARNLQGNQTFAIDLSSELTMYNDDWEDTDIPAVSCAATLHYGNEVMFIRTNVQQVDGLGQRVWFADIELNREVNLGSSAVSVYLEIVWTVNYVAGSSHTLDQVDKSTDGTITATQDASTATKQVYVVFNGNRYSCTFDGATGNISPKPSGMTNGSKYTIENLVLLKVPLSWYTVDYETGTIAMMGEKRLHLPLDSYPNRYIEASGTRPATQVIEQAVILENIYPKLTLRISELESAPMKQKVEYSDGSISYEDWTQWKFQLEYKTANDTWEPFPFKLSYMLDGEKLQVIFSTPSDINATGHLLAGMTFDVGYNEREYTIVRNDDYGVLLPNDALVPSLHDELVLTGWNPRAMNDLDMVGNAEQELVNKGQEYIDAMQDGQYTITCRMMSDMMFDEPFAEQAQKFGLLKAGCAVTIEHDSLPNGTKTSRVLGYEYKLDMPFDTPTYIVGETEAFSRLKRIEKQLTKL